MVLIKGMCVCCPFFHAPHVEINVISSENALMEKVGRSHKMACKMCWGYMGVTYLGYHFNHSIALRTGEEN